MARAAIPENLLEGHEFFVLRFDVDAERLYIHIDDEDSSSYDLGDDLLAAAKMLERWGVDAQFADRAVHQAREFRIVQAIPSQHRVLNLFSRSTARIDVFAHAQAQEPRMMTL